MCELVKRNGRAWYMDTEQIEAAYRHRKRQYETEDCKAHMTDLAE